MRLLLALIFISVGGAAAVWCLPKREFAPSSTTRIKGRIWTRLPKVDVAGLKVQLVKRDQAYPPGPLLGMPWATTDASGRFELSGGPLDAFEGHAEIYLHAGTDDPGWTYDPAVVLLRRNQTIDNVSIELVSGISWSRASLLIPTAATRSRRPD